jgi:hypothetical protein
MSIAADAILKIRPGAVFSIEDGDFNTIVWHASNVDGPPSADEFAAAKAQLIAERPTRNLRLERNRLLAETDWWVLPDRTPTQEQLDYRQALRDLPANTDDPENPVWPVKPGG